VLAVAGNSSRRRHLYLKVVEANALRQRMEQPTPNGRAQRKSSQPERKARDALAQPVYLEDQVAHLEESVLLLEPRIAAIEELLGDVHRKVRVWFSWS
jgi:hypothetical protein